MTVEPPVLLRRDGHAAHIVLNRPRAINALTHEMVGIISAALEEWRYDDSVRTVVLTGAGERGLCAGGDIVAMWRDAKAGGTESAGFWADEYRLNATIAAYPKAYVAIMDGIVLGGGIGLSAHAPQRVVTERSSIGMPETGIGFLPDVGGTWLLSHAPGETGTHLGLTAGSIGAGDAIATGFADHYVPTDRIPGLLADLAHRDADEALADAELPPPPSPLTEARSWLDEAYAGDDVLTILDRLRALGTEEATRAAATIEAKSPTSVRVTLRALREAAGMAALTEALDLEYRLALRFHASHDFVEGVRAQVVDKDRNPQWRPPHVREVDDATVAAYFAPLGEPELGLA
ncbi:MULTISPECIES: enoyl-CoA hydratase/isomerase family protein [unclassified Nocardioides]|uniref:enoyl-CoA hydratase/isomerase family protein n=1 Tax=unclassified Nocardioides TaxID=2615069 RepID=UPI000702948A|nr:MULTISPECIES: enoyl-CoA hydratase/isomerase family protein [unclassified Nocardioides]KRC54154.1 3-hydroxyisobutyryl-CoA hydrolase [Nocardioides sp. Root79]KRC71490.1 3-hydroxyisobutyryl-CoA hydrolase [Nocardioides sp. Root240]